MGVSKGAPALGECWLQPGGAWEALLHVEFLAARTSWRQKRGAGETGRVSTSLSKQSRHKTSGRTLH